MNFQIRKNDYQCINDHYWDGFYKTINDLSRYYMPPSQFAAFCCAELQNKNINQVVEIAAGDGRDTIFFGERGFVVAASEKSAEAVQLLEHRVKGTPNVSVTRNDAVEDKIKAPSSENSICAFYARFFIHVLSKSEVKRFFSNLKNSMKSGDLFMVEYRNEKDADLEKVTPEHFREFYSSKFIASLANKNGMDCIYEVEGTGFAKWQSDDAFVTRQIFVKRGK